MLHLVGLILNESCATGKRDKIKCIISEYENDEISREITYSWLDFKQMYFSSSLSDLKILTHD